MDLNERKSRVGTKYNFADHPAHCSRVTLSGKEIGYQTMPWHW